MMKKLMLLLLLAGLAEASGRHDERVGFGGADGYGYVLTAPIAGVFGRNPSNDASQLRSNHLIDEYIAERRLNLEMEQPAPGAERPSSRVVRIQRPRAKARRRR